MAVRLFVLVSLFVCALGRVHELTQDDFEDTVKEGVWLVKFHSPNCGFCKMLVPQWEEIAKEVSEDDLPMNVGSLNIREARDLSAKYQIGALPGIKLFRDGQVFTLPEPRKSRSNDEFVEFALETYEEVEKAEQERVAQEAKDLAEQEARSDIVKLTLDNFELETAEGDWFIEFYGPKCGYCKKFLPTWEKFATKVKEDGLNFKVGKFDASGEGVKYTRQFKANPWPALKFMSNGRAYTFPEPRNFDMDVDDFLEFATVGYKEEDPIELEYYAAARKRAARKAKYSKKKKKKPKKAKEEGKAAPVDEGKVHDEL